MITRTQAIKTFLNNETHQNLSALYNHGMEVQVNVAQDEGERTDGEFKGHKWQGYTSGGEIWKSFRIPYKANTKPEYEDRKMSFDLAKRADGIGMTGWDWENLVSRWVAFDFDAISGHSDKHETKLSQIELEEVKNAACNIPWVTTRLSTSGKGLHLYVFLPDVPTKNHKEHAALARSIIGKMSAIAGFDFENKVDICGGNMWVWHRKMKDTDGLKIIKSGDILHDYPVNWKDHVKVVAGRRRKIMPGFIDTGENDNKSDKERLFEELTGQRPMIQLDEEHRRLIQFLEERRTQSWWNQDHHMLVTHTYHLKEAQDALGFRGIFKTLSTGREAGADHNCFMFPLRKGAWVVRRYSVGVQEEGTWDQDSHGYTRCFFNREPDLKTSARSHGGVEHPSGGHQFRHAEFAKKTALDLGINMDIPNWLLGRQATLKPHKDGRLIVEIKKDTHDVPAQMEDWIEEKGKWKRIYNMPTSAVHEPEIGNYDDLVRHLVTENGDDYGWAIKSPYAWGTEPFTHVKIALEATGLSAKEVKMILGQSVFQHWRLVNMPFQPEYPGDRKWNRDAAQMRYLPKAETDNLKYPTWLKVLRHCGDGLNAAVEKNSWAKNNGVLNGADYLKCWISSLFQEPTEPLPYLFFYGPQDSGKSIFHEAISLLVTKGSVRADNALISQSGFNGELENAIVCVVEETDLRKNKQAYNRIKDWVTSRQLPIHRKGKTPFHITNTSHWIQCANDYQDCPIFSGDTRITMSYVGEIEDQIPKKRLIPMLEKEASDFISEILSLEIPDSNSRLNVPVIVTDDKIATQKANQSMLEMFMDEITYYVTGEMIKFGEFYGRFQEWLDPNETHKWSKIKVGRELPPTQPKGRLPTTGEFWIGNISFDPKPEDQPAKPRIIVRDDKLVTEDR